MHSGPVLCPWKSPQTVSVSLWLCSHVHAVSRHALSACHTLGFVDAEADGIPAFTIMLSVMGASYRGRAAEPKTDVNRLPSWKRGHPPASVASSTDASTFSSEGDCKETDRCCCKHQQCTAHIIHPFDYGHCNLHLHAINHCDCDARVKDGSEKSNSSSSSSSSRDPGPARSRSGSGSGQGPGPGPGSGSGSGTTCCNIIKTPCFELIPEEACVEQIWYGWCKSYRPVSVAVIHHPIRHECLADDLNEEDDSKPPIPTQVGPTTTPADTCTVTVTSVPDTPAPITIWRSESPTGKSPGGKATKKVKKKKEKDKEEETTDEKTKLKKKPKKGKLTKKKSPVKSECSPPDLTRSLSPRDLARMSESSPESREDLESEESYTDRGQGEPSSEDMVESSSPRKKDRNGAQAKKTGGKTIQARKVNKRKSPPASTPTLS